jgi:Ca-activated chloride channel homolog
MGKARLVLAVLVGMAICLTTDRLIPCAAAQDAPVFTTESSLVVLHVTVKDKQGRYIGGLTRDAFDIFEDGRPQAVSFFTAEDAPVTVGVLIDSSGSMYANRDLVVTAATTFVEHSNPRDEVFGLTFNETVLPALPAGTRFTNDARVLKQALADTIKTRGRTALYDAIADGIEYLAGGQYERKVLVVISDGGDNASETTFEQILDKVRASNVVIHAVGVVDPIDPDSNLKRLRELAEASGGIAFRPGDAHQVREALERVALDIRSAYTMGYAPADTTTGGFRRIRAGVRMPNRKSIVVRTRAGYMAIPPHGSHPHVE